MTFAEQTLSETIVGLDVTGVACYVLQSTDCGGWYREENHPVTPMMGGVRKPSSVVLVPAAPSPKIHGPAKPGKLGAKKPKAEKPSAKRPHDELDPLSM
jgi:hypothetical protein